MIRPPIACTYWFMSSKGPVAYYETLEYIDGSTSCGCLGWTRRVDQNGNRSCKHTRMVESGVGRDNAHRFHDNPTTTALRHQQTTTKTNNPSPMAAPGQRKLIIE